MNKFGLYRLGLLTPRVVVNDPIANADEMLAAMNGKELSECDIIVTPEMSIPSYGALKLFHNRELQQETSRQVARMASEINPNQMIGVGCMVPLPHATYNCTAVLNKGRIIGMVPKEFLPNCNEFEERQWFAPARDGQIPSSISYGGQHGIPFGTRLLFKSHPVKKARLKGQSINYNTEGFEAIVFWELCQAIWEPLPPSSFACLADANIVLNQSASPETVGKQEIRRIHVQSQSGRCMTVYGYCSSSPTESTSDTVMGGHNIIAECGSILKESRRVGDGESPERNTYWIIQDVDVERCQGERRLETSFVEGRKFIEGNPFQTMHFQLEWKEPSESLERFVPAMPFVPRVGPKLDARCAEVTGIMEAALHKRLEAIGAPARKPNLMIGLSGGLDSTMKAVVAHLVCQRMDLNPSCINSWNMPGYGSTEAPKANAATMIEGFGFSGYEVDIRLACLQQWVQYSRMKDYKPFGIIDLTHLHDATLTQQHVEEFSSQLREVPDDDRKDLIFENTQARQRTKLLMDWGFVLGTGDMSEAFQGWCTYNGDHQSMYNTNAGAPKTLIRFLIRYLAKKWYNEQPALRDALIDVSHQVISPELLPPSNDGGIQQNTEDMIGPYELIDFLMWQTCRYGFSPEKILYLGNHAQGWEKEGGYTRLERAKWMKLHYQRFLEWSQFKRDDVPNSVKIGSVCLSPRSGNWRMASDGSGRIWINKCEELIQASK